MVQRQSHVHTRMESHLAFRVIHKLRDWRQPHGTRGVRKRLGKTVFDPPDRDRTKVREWILEVLRGWKSLQQPLARVATDYVPPTQRQEARTGQLIFSA